MKKVNPSPLHCIHKGCDTIPTIVLEFESPNRERIKGQIITCSEHKQEGINMGNGMFGRYILRENEYPGWLYRLHNGILENGMVEGKPVDPTDIERLRVASDSGELKELRRYKSFQESSHRRHRRPGERW